MFDESNWKAGTFHPIVSMRHAHHLLQIRQELSRRTDIDGICNSFYVGKITKLVVEEELDNLNIYWQASMDAFVERYFHTLESDFFIANIEDVALAAVSLIDEVYREQIIKVKKYLDGKYLGKDIRIGLSEDEARELGCFITNVCLAARAVELYKVIEKYKDGVQSWEDADFIHSPRPTCLAEMDHIDLRLLVPFVASNTKPDGSAAIDAAQWQMAKDNARHMFSDNAGYMLAVAPQHAPVQPMIGATRSIYPVRDSSNTGYSTTTITVDYSGLKVVTDVTVDSSDPTIPQGDNSNEAQ